MRLIGAASIEEGAAVAAFDEPGSWLNAIVNLGMAGPVDRGELEAVAGEYVARGIEPLVELCPYAHASAAAACATLGFVVNPRSDAKGIPRGFETVLFREVGRGESAGAVVPDGVELVRVDPGDAAMVREYGAVCLSTESKGAKPPPESAWQTVERVIRHPRVACIAAMARGSIVGVCSVEVDGEVAALFGTKVLPEFRRRGIQRAMIKARLAIAAERGALIATVGSRPGIATERNVRRVGFQTAYTKVMLMRPGPGLRGAYD